MYIVEEKIDFNSGKGFIEILDDPKNRHLLIGFSAILIICYLIFSLCTKDNVEVNNSAPVFHASNKKKKKN